jgi:hypothetical protein
MRSSVPVLPSGRVTTAWCRRIRTGPILTRQVHRRRASLTASTTKGTGSPGSGTTSPSIPGAMRSPRTRTERICGDQAGHSAGRA